MESIEQSFKMFSYIQNNISYISFLKIWPEVDWTRGTWKNIKVSDDLGYHFMYEKWLMSERNVIVFWETLDRHNREALYNWVIANKK
jgi:hypothetical protein